MTQSSAAPVLDLGCDATVAFAPVKHSAGTPCNPPRPAPPCLAQLISTFAFLSGRRHYAKELNGIVNLRQCTDKDNLTMDLVAKTRAALK